MAVASVPGRIPAAERRYEASLTGWLNPALPFYAIAGFPLYWMLGLGYFTFVIAAVPMALQLLMIRPLRVPKGYGLWLMYMAWMLISALTLEPVVTRYLSFGIRASLYLASTIIFLYIYNLPKKYLSTGRILQIGAGIFIFTALIGGYLGLLFGEYRFPTLLSLGLPRGLLSNSFVKNIVNPPLAQTQDFLGFPINRPAMPFSFTNDWGATLVPATFMAIAYAGRATRLRRVLPLIAFVSVVPMVISANRGMWVSLILGVVYVTLRRASAGQLLMAIRLIVVLTFCTAIVLVSPLGEVVGGRATSEHSINARGDIYSDVLERIPDSPILGFGAPVANPNPNRPAIGTHGMFWTALFSQGIPGAIMHLGFWIGMTVRTGRNIRNQEQLWLHLAVASAIPTMFWYDHLPAALPLMMIAAATILRDRRHTDALRREALAASAVAS